MYGSIRVRFPGNKRVTFVFTDVVEYSSALAKISKDERVILEDSFWPASVPVALAAPHDGPHPAHSSLLAPAADRKDQPPQPVGKETQMNVKNMKPGDRVRFAVGGPLLLVRRVGPRPGQGMTMDDHSNHVVCVYYNDRICEFQEVPLFAEELIPA